MNSENDVKDVILHEIAHALIGHGNGHNRVFYRKCIEIGSTPQRCYGQNIKKPKPKYYVYCPNHCMSTYRNRKLRGAYCPKCMSRVIYETISNKQWQKSKEGV